jgi:hypothetical protein
LSLELESFDHSFPLPRQKWTRWPEEDTVSLKRLASEGATPRQIWEFFGPPLVPSLWTSERMELLKQLAGLGYSANQIGIKLAFSRSAIAGKCYRLGITLRGATGKKEPGKARRGGGMGRSRASVVPRPKSTPQLLAPRKVKYLDLKQNHCRYLVDETDDDCLPLSCGHPTVAGSSCCAAHYRMVYQARVRSGIGCLPTKR